MSEIEWAVIELFSLITIMYVVVVVYDFIAKFVGKYYE